MREPFQFLREMVPQTKRLSDLVRENRVRYTVMNSAAASGGGANGVGTTDTKADADVQPDVAEVNEDGNLKPPAQQQQPPSSQSELKGDSTGVVEVGTETETGNQGQVAAAASRNDIKEIVEINISNNTDEDEDGENDE